ncbi:MAG: nucleotidyltransferase family protein [Bacteroidales bacterium]|nr:nucleotidyltransferase family protein [Bacteroidales bacterium]
MKNIILNYLASYNPEMIGIFGSYARNEENPNSDIDLLVRFKKTPSLLQLIKIENELSEELGFKVDLLTEGAITNSRIKKNILEDLQVIYYA